MIYYSLPWALFLQSCSLFHESGSVSQFQRFEIFQDGLLSPLLLNLVQPAVEPHAIPTPETLLLETNMKWIGWPVAKIWPFEMFQKLMRGRSSVGRSSILYVLTLISYTPLRYVRTVACEEYKAGFIFGPSLPDSARSYGAPLVLQQEKTTGAATGSSQASFYRTVAW